MSSDKLGIKIIAVVAAAIFGISYHGEAVSKSYDEGFNSGYSEASQEAENRIEGMAQKWYSEGYDDGYDDGYSVGQYKVKTAVASSANINRPSYSTSQSTTVYVTETGSKYHRSGCSYLKSKIAISLSSAKAQGYTACSRCY